MNDGDRMLWPCHGLVMACDGLQQAETIGLLRFVGTRWYCPVII